MLNKLGEYISLVNNKNGDESISKDYIKGISTNKEFIETKADLTNISVKNYKIVEPQQFAYVADTSRRGDKISLAFNDTNGPILVSTISTVFEIKQSKREKLHPLFLYIYFNRPEFDRISRFNSWGSARETFSFEDLCDLRIEVPSMEIQQKYFDVYNALVANQKAYENGLDDLKIVCDGYLEQLKILDDVKPIGSFINARNEKNQESKILRVRGLSSVEKSFIKPKRNINKNTLHNYNVVYPNDIAYRPVVTGYDDSLCIALSKESKNVVISPIYPVFYVKDTNKLLPDYLFMWLSKSAFDKYAWYHSTGSARETLDFEILSEYKIPIPHIKVQQSIVDIYKVYETRKEINEKLKQQIKEICPVLIKGAIQESKGVI